MPSFNKAIKRTTLIELLIIILCFYSVYMVASFYGFNVDMEWMFGKSKVNSWVEQGWHLIKEIFG